MNFNDLKDIIPYCLGIISTLIGIILGVIRIIEKIKQKQKEKLKIKDFSKQLILILIGLILILMGFIINIKYKCGDPIEINSPHTNDTVDGVIDIGGKVSCVAPNSEIAILIHQLPQKNIIEWWFIHTDCAPVQENNSWKLSNIIIGTEYMKGCGFDIFAYVVNDSICKIISQETKLSNNPPYAGTPNKPPYIYGAHAKITIKRKP